jgi:hypothetical protein
MKLSLEKKAELSFFGIRASNLLVEIIDEPLPKEKIPTRRDIEFKEILAQINSICPLLSDSYMLMYNYIQKEKSNPKEDSYLKHLRRNNALS